MFISVAGGGVFAASDLFDDCLLCFFTLSFRFFIVLWLALILLLAVLLVPFFYFFS